jgi:hypothetical protein
MTFVIVGIFLGALAYLSKLIFERNAAVDELARKKTKEDIKEIENEAEKSVSRKPIDVLVDEFNKRYPPSDCG